MFPFRVAVLLLPAAIECVPPHDPRLPVPPAGVVFVHEDDLHRHLHAHEDEPELLLVPALPVAAISGVLPAWSASELAALRACGYLPTL